MQESLPDATKIIIAQRVSSVENSDRIIILDGGKIVAVGSHDELMKTCEIYREAYSVQNKSDKEDE